MSKSITKYGITLNKDEYDWFIDLLQKTKYVLDSNPTKYKEFITYFEKTLKAFNSAKVSSKEIKTSTVKPKKVYSSAKKKVVKKKELKVCVDHPSYKGDRRPRSDCRQCYGMWKHRWPERAKIWESSVQSK